MDPWINELVADIERLGSSDLLRQLRVVEPDGPYIVVRGKRLINLSSNDYLGLSTHPALKAAAIQCIENNGVGSGSSRLVGGHQTVHAQAEARFASFKHAQGALLFPTGYMANLATLSTLARPGDLICSDKLNHASLHDAARASGAYHRVYPHRSLDKLARLLRRHHQASATTHRTRSLRPKSIDSFLDDDGVESILTTAASAPATDDAARPVRRLIVTDSVFSMDGDVADLPALCDLADEFDAILVVDEAHGTGILGPTGAGLAELQGVAERVDVVISTASKALGGLGGIVTAREVVIQTLSTRARQFIYTTAVPPVQCACILAALDVIRDEPQRRTRLLELSRRLRDQLIAADLLEPKWRQDDAPTPIIPIIVGDSRAALELSAHLETHGFFAPAIRPPTVAPHAARVRLSLRADLPDDQIDRLVEAIAGFRRA